RRGQRSDRAGAGAVPAALALTEAVAAGTPEERAVLVRAGRCVIRAECIFCGDAASLAGAGIARAALEDDRAAGLSRIAAVGLGAVGRPAVAVLVGDVEVGGRLARNGGGDSGGEEDDANRH